MDSSVSVHSAGLDLDGTHTPQPGLWEYHLDEQNTASFLPAVAATLVLSTPPPARVGDCSVSVRIGQHMRNITARLRKPGAVLLIGVAAASYLGIGGTASAAAGQDSLLRGQSLYAGQQIQRDLPNGWQLQLVMQGDDNLVEYLRFDDGSRLACWATGTYGVGWNAHAIYQYDGNFVVYSDDPNHPVLWASNTNGQPGSTVDMNINGVVYAGQKAINPKGC